MERKKVDFSGICLNGQRLPAVYVKSKIIRKTSDSAFGDILAELDLSLYPGYFFTPSGKGDKFPIVRLHLNRHGIIRQNTFRDKKDMLYRDIDAKGMGFVHGIPMQVLPIQESSMEGDMELRGLSHYSPSEEEWLNGEELHELGFRVARPVAEIELFELVNKNGNIVSRTEILNEFGLNDKVRPVIQIRAMGTTSRVSDLLNLDRNTSYNLYAKEIIDDAIGIVSDELGIKIKPADYAIWFIETLSSMVGKLHSINASPDFRMQIHGGTHNVTLDCRLIDTHLYETPKSLQRMADERRRTLETRPDLAKSLGYHREPSQQEIQANYAQVEKKDRQRTLHLLERFIGGVDNVYPLKGLVNEVNKRFGETYGRNYRKLRGIKI